MTKLALSTPKESPRGFLKAVEYLCSALQNCIVGSTGNGVSGNSLPSKFTSLYSQWNNVQRLVGFYLGNLNNLGDKIKKKTHIN